MWEIWTDKLLTKALKNCTKSRNLVTLDIGVITQNLNYR